MNNPDSIQEIEITTDNLIKVLGLAPDRAKYLLGILSLNNTFLSINTYKDKYLFVDCIEDRELKESLLKHLTDEGFNVVNSALSDCFRIDSLS